jgi:short-subunit dehydrogenase
MTVTEKLGEGLPVLKSKDGKPGLCLVTGATGYIGGRLVAALLEHGIVFPSMARSAAGLTKRTR